MYKSFLSLSPRHICIIHPDPPRIGCRHSKHAEEWLRHPSQRYAADTEGDRRDDVL